MGVNDRRMEAIERDCDCPKDACAKVRGKAHLAIRDMQDANRNLDRAVDLLRKIRADMAEDLELLWDWHSSEECETVEPDPDECMRCLTKQRMDEIDSLVNPPSPKPGKQHGADCVCADGNTAACNPLPCLDPDKMHGAGDGFGGSDYPDVRL